MQAQADHPIEPPARRRSRKLRVGMSALFLGLVLVTCTAVALIPLLAGSGSETQTYRALLVLFAALFTLLGLLLVFTERQIRRRGRAQALIPFVKLFFTSLSGLTFWIGLVLVGIAVTRLESPAVAGPLNNVFWAVVGLWLLLQLLFNARRVMRPRRARAPGRDEV